MGAGGLSPLAPLTLTTERQLPYVNERLKSGSNRAGVGSGSLVVYYGRLMSDFVQFYL